MCIQTIEHMLGGKMESRLLFFYFLVEIPTFFSLYFLIYVYIYNMSGTEEHSNNFESIWKFMFSLRHFETCIIILCEKN